MAELEVDQSNLPRVQEVSQYFSVLEDGALAHNLQEQEIEQYYSSNVQRNQLVRKDISVAKRLQDEEQQRAQILHEPDTRQLEEQDLEYARRIQEEIQRTAEEERRREEKDEEIAKQIQEEEVLYVRQRNSYRRTDARESSTISTSKTLQPSQPLYSEEEAWHSRAHAPSPSTSDYGSDHCEHRRSRNRDYADHVEQRRQPGGELPLRRRSGQSRSSFASQSSATEHLQGGWGDVVRLIKNDMSEQGYLSYSSEDELFEPIYKLESMLSRRQQASERRSKQGTRLSHHSSMREENSRMCQEDQAGGYRHSDYKDSQSVRSESRQIGRYSNGYCTSGDGQRRVRFQDDQKRQIFYSNGRKAFVENYDGKGELRSYTVKQVDKRPSFGEVNRIHKQKWGNGMRNSLSQEIREEEKDGCELGERERWEEGSCRVRTQHRLRARSLREELRHEGGESRRYCGEPIRRRVRSERWQGNQEDRSSTEEEEEEEEEVDRERGRRRVETPAPKHYPLSLRASRRGRSPRAGQTVNRPSLDLGELGQVLQDEELARRLQAEEEEFLRGDLASATPLESSHPKGDFTVAQVAQDEEIARFMQKQEIKVQKRSQELEDGGSGYREVNHMYDGTEAYDGQMQRERLNSEGLLSPVDECSPEHHPPSPVNLEAQQQSFRNIAEQLDPTFQRKENVQAEQSISGTCHIQTLPQAGSCEEPAIVTPTKRQNDKVVRVKSKEKKENSKSKENCKQQ